MNIEKLKEYTLNKLLELEQQENYNPNLPLNKSIGKKYNTLRSMKDYIQKFPTLTTLLKDEIKFLEIGAGEGIAFKEIIKKFRVEAVATNITLTDHDPLFINAVASKLPFNDNSFDLVISIQSITWEPNQKKAIQEVMRVLKPKGTALINLYKFSEITTLWFDEDFWKNFSKENYKKKFEFAENDYTDSVLWHESIFDTPPMSNSFYLVLNK